MYEIVRVPLTNHTSTKMLLITKNAPDGVSAHLIEETASLESLGRISEVVMMSSLAQGETAFVPITAGSPVLREPPPPKPPSMPPVFSRQTLLEEFATYILSRAESCTSGDDKMALYLPALFEALGVKRLPMKDATAMIREALPRDAAYCAEILLTGHPWDASLG
ncbi:MAG: hypothetical protein Q8O76_01955, partial [Chloroflexota bacterium]|nr:hypothetical protein [Chloroflexota bacterium]